MRPAVVIGDIHGNIQLLERLVSEVRTKFGNDVDIYSTGDLIDRGSNSKEVIQLCVDEKISAQLGNHEQWIKNLVDNYQFDTYALEAIMGGQATLASYGVDPFVKDDVVYINGRDPIDVAIELIEALPESHQEFILNLPMYRKLEVDGKTYWLTHAGVSKTLYNRWCVSSDGTAKILSDDETMERIVQNNPNAILWSTPNLGAFGRPDNLMHFNFEAIQVFGHRPVKSPIVKRHFIAVDTGCGTCDPYELSAVVLPTHEIISVR